MLHIPIDIFALSISILRVELGIMDTITITVLAQCPQQEATALRTKECL